MFWLVVYVLICATTTFFRQWWIHICIPTAKFWCGLAMVYHKGKLEGIFSSLKTKASFLPKKNKGLKPSLLCARTKSSKIPYLFICIETDCRGISLPLWSFTYHRVFLVIFFRRQYVSVKENKSLNYALSVRYWDNHKIHEWVLCSWLNLILLCNHWIIC